MAFNCPHCQQEISDAQIPELRTFVRHEGKVQGVQFAAVVQLLSLIVGVGLFFYVSSSLFSTFGSLGENLKAYQPIQSANVEPGRMEKVADGIVIFASIQNPDKRALTNPQFQLNFFDSEKKFIDQCQVTSVTKVAGGERQNLKLKCGVSVGTPNVGFAIPNLEAATIERAASFELKFLQAMPDYLALGAEGEPQ